MQRGTDGELTQTSAKRNTHWLSVRKNLEEDELYRLQVIPSVVRLMKQANVFPLKKTLKKFIIWEINNDKGILKEDFQASSRRTTKLEETLTQFMLVTMSNHKSTESALKNLEVQMGQLAKQIADKSSYNFVANIEQNPKEECKAVMTRSKRFVEAEVEENVVHKEKATEKKGTEIKKNDMASRKRKSISSRPTTQYDTRRFSSLNAWTRYTDNVLGRNILPKRKVEIYHSKIDEFKAELERRNFHKHLTNLVDGSIDLALVKEFYANLYSSEDRPPKQSRVRGHLVKIDANSLNTFLETPVVLVEGETLLAYSRYCRLPTDYREIEAALCIPGRGFILNSEDHLGKILRKDLTTLARSNISRLRFPALITALCRARRVVSDSLTFECLSPVINLAYIRKNCWNPEGLTVSIRGARRARARLVELPSTSAAPTPASTSAASSVVAPPGSIPSVEQFKEMVAWPGTQPSLHKEDEGPTTQVLQHVEDESSEATIPKPFVIGEEAEETQVRQVAAATLERSLEATSEPSAPVVNLPSPQLAADPSTPLLEMLEDPTTPILAMDTSPPATPVLHLTDEEDVQTQDT
ncbi:hypothetical protein HKD37_02G005000 [Glycine soja]